MRRELFSPEHGRNGPEPADGNSPLRQVLAAPGGDAGPLASSAPANSNVLARFPAGRSTGRRPVPRYIIARTSRLYRLQRTRGRPWQSGPPESAHCPGHLSLGRRKVIHDYPRHFPEFLPLASSRRRAAGSRMGAASRRDTGRRRGPGARARAAPRHDRHGPNPRPPAQIRSNLPRGATRSSTARYFILDRIKVTYLYFCAAGRPLVRRISRAGRAPVRTAVLDRAHCQRGRCKWEAME